MITWNDVKKSITALTDEEKREIEESAAKPILGKSRRRQLKALKREVASDKKAEIAYEKKVWQRINKK